MCVSTSLIVIFVLLLLYNKVTKFKYHLCYYLNLFAILAKETVRYLQHIVLVPFLFRCMGNLTINCVVW